MRYGISQNKFYWICYLITSNAKASLYITLPLSLQCSDYFCLIPFKDYKDDVKFKNKIKLKKNNNTGKKKKKRL